jgi:AraC-like DNA-binding protein
LAAAHAELAQCGPRAGVTAIARRWGFIDGAHFSRRFRRFRTAYGMSPRSWRDANSRA